MSDKPSKFSNPSFHREKTGNVPKPAAKPKPKPKDSQFIQQLADTGKANWKIAPKAIKTRYYGIYMVLFSIPVLLLSSYELFRRLEGKSTKKVQQGELLEGNEVRKFSEQEKWKVERESLMYRIFGRDFFLDGFTSKTLGKGPEVEGKKRSEE